MSEAGRSTGHALGLSARRNPFVAVFAAPGRLFFGPVFDKELRVAGRKRGPYVLRMVYATILLIVASLAFAEAWDSGGVGSQTARAMRLQEIAPTLAEAVIWTQFVAAALFAPALTASAVSEERRRQTLSALLTTPVTASQIVCNKLMAALVNLAVVLLLSVPLLLAIRAFGGLPLERVLSAAVLTLSMAALGAAVGVSVSTLRSGDRNALMAAFVVFLGAMFVPSLLILAYNISAQITLQAGGTAPGWLPTIPWEWLWQTSPPITLAALRFEVFGDPWEGRWLWIRCSAWTLFLASMFCLQAVLRLRKLMRTDPTAVLLTKKAKKEERRARRAAKKAAKGGAVAAGAQPEQGDSGGNEETRDARDIKGSPVLWRELRQPQFRSLWRMILTAVVALGILGFAYFQSSLGNGNGWVNNRPNLGPVFEGEGIHVSVALICLVLLLFQAAVTTTGGMTTEREGRTIDVLLTTGLTPRQIMVGKLLGSLRRLWFIPALATLHFTLALASGWVHPAVVVILLMTWVPPVVMLCCTGLALSLSLKKTLTASILNLSLALLMWPGVMLFFGLVGEALDLHTQKWFRDLFSEYAMLIPVLPNGGGIANLVHDTLNTNSRGYVRLSDVEFNMLNDPMGFAGLFVRMLISAIYHLGVGVIALLITFGRFNRVTGRTS